MIITHGIRVCFEKANDKKDKPTKCSATEGQSIREALKPDVYSLLGHSVLDNPEIPVGPIKQVQSFKHYLRSHYKISSVYVPVWLELSKGESE